MKKGKLSGLLAGTVVLAAAGFIVYANLNAAPFGASSSPAAGPNGAAAARLLSDTGAAARAAPESPAVPQSGSGQNPGSRPDNPAASGAGRPGGGNPGGAPAGRSGGNAIVVDTAPAELGSLEATAKLTGEVQAARSLKVYPETAGRLIEVVPAGTRVEEGGVVARVDPSKPGSRFEPSPVRAPLSGTVVAVLLETGANVISSSAIVEIATVSELEVVVRVPERWSSDLSVGSRADVTLPALPGRVFPARVRSADPVIDPVSRSKRVLFRLSGDLSRVEPGMFAQVSVVLSRSASSLLIPLEAVVRRGGADFVYVVDGGVARERTVRLGLFSETGAEVISGVKLGELVVVRGQNLIRDGSKVNPSGGIR